MYLKDCYCILRREDYLQITAVKTGKRTTEAQIELHKKYEAKAGCNGGRQEQALRNWER